jgi:hypothetical protein
MMAIWRAIQDKPANSYVLKWRYNLASPDRDALMNGRFAPTAAVPGEVGFLTNPDIRAERLSLCRNASAG